MPPPGAQASVKVKAEREAKLARLEHLRVRLVADAKLYKEEADAAMAEMRDEADLSDDQWDAVFRDYEASHMILPLVDAGIVQAEQAVKDATLKKEDAQKLLSSNKHKGLSFLFSSFGLLTTIAKGCNASQRS